MRHSTSRRGRSVLLAVPVLVALVAACTAQGDREGNGHGIPKPSAAPSATPHSRAGGASSTPSPSKHLTRADAKACPVTIPSKAPPTVSSLYRRRVSHGNGRLWVGGLGPHGVVVAGPSSVGKNGSIGWKFGWWRKAAGTLTITGRRLDASAPPLRSDVPPGYGKTGFQASGVIFPTEGCWRITGHVDHTTLTFTTFVIKKRHARHTRRSTIHASIPSSAIMQPQPITLRCNDGTFGLNVPNRAAMDVNGVVSYFLAGHPGSLSSSSYPTVTSAGRRYVAIKSVLYATPKVGRRATVTLLAPSSARLFYTDWGHWAGVHHIPRTARSVTVASCGHHALGYPGFLLVRRPTCLTYRVTSDNDQHGEKRTVSIGRKTCRAP